jgi:hypothetical protein
MASGKRSKGYQIANRLEVGRSDGTAPYILQGQQRLEVHAGFQRIAGLPEIIGAIDCTHIPFHEAPNNHRVSYWSRKMRYSLNVVRNI